MRIDYNVCDRCGKKIVYRGATSQIRRAKSKIKFTQLWNGNPSGYEYSENYIELCAYCTAVFKDWMREGKE